MVSNLTVGPTTPQLTAALAADAAGLAGPAREHFETALRHARDVPLRNHHPSILYWYGRTLGAASESGERARGRAMVADALVEFRAFEMILHAGLAERLLREQDRGGSPRDEKG